MGSKSIKRLVGLAAPLAGLIPGIGLPLAVGLGAGGGLLSGGGLKGALSGGLGAAALGGGGSLLGSALGAGTGAAGNALGTGLLGAGAGAATGGLKGAALGGVAGGLGGYASAGGFNGIGESLGLTGADGLIGPNGSLSGVGNVLGVNSNLNAGYNPGDVVAGEIGKTGAISGAGSGAGMSSFGTNGVGNLLSGISGINANDDAEKELLKAQQQSLGAIQPYLNAKFEPGDLTQDPGYKFRLDQGQQAIDRSLGARGSLFSGRALQAAQDYGQGLADSTYNDAYNRWLAQNGQNIGAAGMATGIYNEGGNARANASVANSNVLNRTLSGLFGNGSFGNQGQSFNTGTGLTPEQIAQLLAQRQGA